MPDAPIFIRRLELTAFRAYLVPAAFDFSKKKCLGILGANRLGKTSLVDGFEFLFSDDGTLERLGSRTVQTKAGPIALAHASAEAAGLVPMVSIDLIESGKISKCARPASGIKRPRPAEVTELKSRFIVDPIIRAKEGIFGLVVRFGVDNDATRRT
jgi:ABC-type Mn2+/Zn2+ transport system ATPase subunit